MIRDYWGVILSTERNEAKKQKSRDSEGHGFEV